MELYKLGLILVWLSSSSCANKLTNALYNRFGVYESRFKFLKTGFQKMENRMDVMEKKIYSKRLNCDVCVDDNKRLKQLVDNMQKAFDNEKRYVQEMKRTLEGQIKILMEQVTEKQQTNVRPNKGYTMTTLAPKYTGLIDVITTPAAYPKSTDVVGEIKTETVIPKNTTSVYTTTGTTSASTSSFRTITLFPKNVNVFHDMKVSFFCMAIGIPSTDFFWEHNGKVISSGRNRYAIIDMTERSGSMLRIDPVRKRRDTGVITCVATNKYGTTRVVARLNVYDESKKIPDGYPRITKNPHLKAVEKGFTARLQCDAISVKSPELPTFYWLKDGIPVETNDPKFSIENGTLVIESADELDEGKYECVAENSVGVAYSFSANLYVRGYTMTTLAPKYTGLIDVITTPAAYPKSTDGVGEIKTETVIPKNTTSVYRATGTTSASTSSFRTITLFPKNVNVFHDMKVSFFCMATGSPSTDFFWEHNGKAISSGRNRYAIIDMTERSGSVLRIDPVRKRRDTGVITCVATNKYGTTRVVARLNVYDESKRIPDGYPRITKNPRLKAVEKGFPAKLQCDAISVKSPELPTLYWLKDGIPVETNDPKFSIENGTLLIESADELDEGKYECVAENSVGVAYSFSANLYVKVRRVPPYFSQEPRAVINVVPGADVNLTCKANGSPMPSISWKHSYQYLSGEPQLGQAVLVLRNVTHPGNVSCVAESQLGKIETQTSVFLVKQGKRTDILTPSIGGW